MKVIQQAPNSLRYLRVGGREYGEGEEHSSFPHYYLLYSPPNSAQQKSAFQLSTYVLRGVRIALIISERNFAFARTHPLMLG